MLQDKNRSFDMDGNDLSAINEPGFLTPDQYNSSLEYSFLFTFLISFLQMNNVPRADSPRNGPMRSSLDFNRPSNRLITNGSAKSANSLNSVHSCISLHSFIRELRSRSQLFLLPFHQTFIHQMEMELLILMTFTLWTYHLLLIHNLPYLNHYNLFPLLL